MYGFNLRSASPPASYTITGNAELALASLASLPVRLLPNPDRLPPRSGPGFHGSRSPQTPNSTGIKSQTSGSAKDRINGWFNPTAFADAAPLTFGTVGRFLPDNFGPPLHNRDVSILKGIHATERVRLQFRAELFNAFNQVNLANPGGTVFGQPDFGRITGADAARIIQFGLKLYY
jgi:hypothetical protein